MEYDDAIGIPYINYVKVAKNQKWGMIDFQQRIIIPFEWDILDIYNSRGLIFGGIEESCELYAGSEDRLQAAIFNIPVEATCDHRLRWGVFDRDCNLIVKPELDDRPTLHKKFTNYYILKKNRRYGVLSKDGQLISGIILFKNEAIELMRTLSN